MARSTASQSYCAPPDAGSFSPASTVQWLVGFITAAWPLAVIVASTSPIPLTQFLIAQWVTDDSMNYR
jgi:hypothetical protein